MDKVHVLCWVKCHRGVKCATLVKHIRKYLY